MNEPTARRDAAFNVDADAVDRIMALVTAWEEAVFMVNEKGQPPALEMRAYAAVRAAVEQYGRKQRQAGYEDAMMRRAGSKTRSLRQRGAQG